MDCTVGRLGGERIEELLGSERHEHYRVRWDENHDSIVYPTDGVIITPQATRRGA